MIGLLLDPDAALDAVNNAVRLVKKASATAQNIESLAPMLGKYFDAKANAIASAEAAKAGTFGGSSMGKAFEIEMAIDSQKEFEEDLKRLFWNANKMDVWQKIKARATVMEAEAAKAAAAEAEPAVKPAGLFDRLMKLVSAVHKFFFHHGGICRDCDFAM